MNIHFDNRQTDLPVSSNSISSLVEAVLAFEGQTCNEVGIHFVNAEEICALHQQFFDDPSITDCISFPIDGISKNVIGYCVLGDVIVRPKVAIDYAEKHKGEPYKEASLYVVHGLLHLMGYDDIEEKDRVEMRKAEVRHMRHLKALKKYLHA